MQIDPVRRQSLIAFLTTIGFTLVGYLSTIYFAHALGPSILGSYFLFLAYYGIFDLISDGGFGGAAIKRISEGYDPDRYFSAFFSLKILLLAFAVLIVLGIKPYLIDLNTANLTSWLIIAIIAGTIYSVITSGIIGTKQVGIAQISGFFNVVIKITMQIFAVYIGYAAGGLAAGFIAGIIAGCLINIRYFNLKLTTFDFSHLKSLFSFSLWTFLAAGGSLIFTYSDVILIGFFIDNAEVGIYRVALQLTTVASFIAIALHGVLFPHISHLHAKGEMAMIGASISRAITFSLFLAIPVAAGGSILREQLLYFFYGADFATGAIVLPILLMAQIATIFMYLQTMCLNAIDLPKKSFIATLIAACANIVLNIALIPLIGISGAALATFFSIILNSLISYRYLAPFVEIKIEYKPILIFLMAAFVMIFIIETFRYFGGIPNVIILFTFIFIGACIYLLVVFYFDKYIKDELKGIVLKLGIPWPQLL